ncbi:hypothetical protein SCHPADRAFT_999338 [Schizopora paradoxa]|uniref:MYND-type domain-containing protein n=1 Tax=Schizopora paradoxa TaxID=27342 RepID=A0A0H2S1A1_9AGAM|nr:hypothetical protein SCHPADRAFT_999338 [Schizopora paradoxa]
MKDEISERNVEVYQLPEEFRKHLIGLLRKNPSALFKMPQGPKIYFLYAFSDENVFSIYPDDVLPGVFRFCCGMVKELASLAENAIEADGSTWSSQMYHALLALEVLASSRMQQCVGSRDDRCIAPVLEHWDELFFGVKTLYRAARARDARMETHDARLVGSQFSDVLFKIFRNRTVLSSFRDDVELRKFMWTLWLSNGVLDSGGADLACGSISVVLMILSSYSREGKAHMGSAVMLPICMAICDDFGGKDTVAEIALMSAYQTLMSNDKKLIMKLLPQKVAILAMLAGSAVDPTLQIEKRISELDGVAKLIEGTVNAIKNAPDEDLIRNYWDSVMGGLVTLINRLATENYILLAHAIRSGLLRIPLVVQKIDDNILESTNEACCKLIESISLFFSYHSIIQALSEQFRLLTKEEEACMLADGAEGTIDFAWNTMKRYLVGSYAMMRMFDICMVPFPKCCNNCANPEAQHSFSQCARCMRVFYCSEKCQEMDLKAGRHLESCREVYGEGGPSSKDMPFLYFLANKQIRSRYLSLIGPGMFPSGGMLFVLDATETKDQETVIARPSGTANEELHQRRKRASDSYRVTDCRTTRPSAEENGEPIYYIQAMHREGRERCVVRYLPIDLDPQRFVPYGSSENESDILQEIMNDLHIKYAGADLKKSWTLSDRDGERIHLFDEVDTYFRDKFRK